MRGKSQTMDFHITLHIVGENRLLNELLRYFLEKEAELMMCCCQLHPDIPQNPDRNPGEKHLVLFDCICAEFPETFARLSPKRYRCCSALFNALPDKKFEKQAIAYGIRGVFYRSESPQNIVYGIHAILNNELRYSREVLSAFISERHPPENMPALTQKEREVLDMIVRDMKNPDIAEQLGVSIHTIKTHVCRIYRKLGVPNRYQAMLWAKKYL